jgi:hypothetical protein
VRARVRARVGVETKDHRQMRKNHRMKRVTQTARALKKCQLRRRLNLPQARTTRQEARVWITTSKGDHLALLEKREPQRWESQEAQQPHIMLARPQTSTRPKCLLTSRVATPLQISVRTTWLRHRLPVQGVHSNHRQCKEEPGTPQLLHNQQCQVQAGLD